MVGGFPGTNLDPDRLTWSSQEDGKFSVNRQYKWGARGRAGRTAAHGKQSGRLAPTKLKCFTWLVSRELA